MNVIMFGFDAKGEEAKFRHVLLDSEIRYFLSSTLNVLTFSNLSSCKCLFVIAVPRTLFGLV